MKTTEIRVKIADIIDGYTYSQYEDETDNGVYTNVKLNGETIKLNIRPKYQRNFVYDTKKQKAVIDSVMRGYPLNKMYWYKNADGTYGILDGQQRTLSILRFSANKVCVDFNNVGISWGTDSFIKNFAPNGKTFKEQFLSYELDICLCEEEMVGDREGWFERVNTSSDPLSAQELRNANYQSKWLDDAKYHFSRTSWHDGIPTSQIVLPYMKVKADEINRQKCLEKAIEWICKRDGIKGEGNRDAISVYMGNCREENKENANELIEYAENIAKWVSSIFTDYNHFEKIKDVDWQGLYEKYKDNSYDADDVKDKYDVAKKQLDDAAKEDSTFKADYKGLFEYVLSNGEINHLSTRLFADTYIQQKYNEQGGICPKCGEWHPISEMQGDHIIAFSRGGETKYGNLQLLCEKCNKGKGAKDS